MAIYSIFVPSSRADLGLNPKPKELEESKQTAKSQKGRKSLALPKSTPVGSQD